MQVDGNSSFVEKARGIVYDNLKNEQFGVVDLSDKLSLSRSQLHRKIKLKTGKSVSQFIRDVRLEEAIKLLKSDSETVSEIAYKVGFSSSTYFNRCFRQVYGIAPGEVRKLSPGDPSFPPQADLDPSTMNKSGSRKYRLSIILVLLVIAVGVSPILFSVIMAVSPDQLQYYPFTILPETRSRNILSKDFMMP